MFNGFTPETIDFLWGIRMNNNREWFTENKKKYTDFLYEPMKALGQEVFAPFMETPGNLLKVSRIYRDARLHHPLPYKECLWFCIRQNNQDWAEYPCLYFELGPDGANYGLSLYKPKTGTMEAFRRHISAHPDEFLTLLKSTEEAVGMPVSAVCYKRPKATENPDLAPYFAWKEQIFCVREIAPGPELFGPELKEEVMDFFRKLMPLYDYLNRFKPFEVTL